MLNLELGTDIFIQNESLFSTWCSDMGFNWPKTCTCKSFNGNVQTTTFFYETKNFQINLLDFCVLLLNIQIMFNWKTICLQWMIFIAILHLTVRFFMKKIEAQCVPSSSWSTLFVPPTFNELVQNFKGCNGKRLHTPGLQFNCCICQLLYPYL